MSGNSETTIIKVMPLKDLAGKRFFIPAYQRGYRWGEDEVKLLMDDLRGFFDGSDASDYCLQPLVVMKRSDGTYEVIDGQQRLTTALILWTLSDEDKDQDNKYTITYETRKDSTDFLKKIRNPDRNEKENPDFYYMAQARDAIEAYVPKEIPSLGRGLDNLKKHLNFIWYEIPAGNNDTAIELFRKINVGKIPLTNADLVKALLLKKSKQRAVQQPKVSFYEIPEEMRSETVSFINQANTGTAPLTDADTVQGLILFKTNHPQDRNHERNQILIASDWDRMEHRLQDDSFFYFLTNRPEEYPSRIDLVLDIWRQAQEKGHKPDHAHDPYAVFKRLYEGIKGEETDFLQNMWEEVKTIFSYLEYWYADPAFYHGIGFLIATGKNKINVCDIYSEVKGCDRTVLYEIIRGKIRQVLLETLTHNGRNKWEESLAGLTYEQPADVRRILLFFNIASLTPDKFRQRDPSDTFKKYSSWQRFPFDSFKKQSWDIEHIHATAGGPPKNEDLKTFNKNYQNDCRKQFFEGTLDLLNSDKSQYASKELDSLIEAVASFIKKENENEKQDSEGFSDASCKKFWDDHHEKIEDKLGDQNNIKNLALLSSDINRAYGNANFCKKRSWIIRKDQEGSFIPPCTKNVFLKYYSETDRDILIWGLQDRENYLKAITETLKSVMSEDKNDK